MKEELTCNQISALINFYLENKLTPRLKKCFEKHLETCPRCAEKIKELKKILNQYKSHKTPSNEHSQNNVDESLIRKLSAYADNELDENENIKIKRMTITNQNIRKELENIYKFKKMIHSAYEKTREENRIDYSRGLVAKLQSTTEYSTDYFYKLATIFVLLLGAIIAGFLYLYF